MNSSPSQSAGASNLPPRYAPGDHEPHVIEKWDTAGAFHADPGPVIRGEKTPYAVVIPPPNVTDRLHLGHALNNSLQDILVRAHRMMGFEAIWFPGTDHAGIATQTKVDRTLVADGKPGLAHYKKKELAGEGGRDEFIALVQSWKDKYEAEIIGQLKRMGCSCDWERTRFTMDDVCARAVREAFFRFFKDGLIYRGKRLVNWDPASQTALSDDEVENKEVDGNFYYMRYPVVRSGAGVAQLSELRPVPVTWAELRTRGYPANLIPEKISDADQAFITVATTRPETYLGDTGVGVNPRDPRAKSLEGLSVQLPLVGRIIPIIADDYVVMPASISGSSDDPKAAFATGFLKITPAHDENDWALGLRHNLEVINVMAPDASISDKHGWTNVGEAGVFVGLSREDARREVVKAFKARDLMEKVTPYRHSVGHSYRSHVPIEPYLSDQWYLKVTDDRLVGFAQRALAKSDSGSGSGSVLGSATLRVAPSVSLPLLPISPPGFVARDPYPPHEPKAKGLIESLRNLPHLSLPDATYFVTWRTADTTLSEAERSTVVDAIKHWHGKTVQVYALCVMPDHVHCIVRPFDGLALGDWVASVKKFGASKINADRSASGHLWQVDRFDHIVRDARWFSEFLTYILQNPVEEGLCAEYAAYPWSLVDPSVAAAVEQKGSGRNSESCATPDRTPESSGDGALRIFPDRYAKTYETWHGNLRDWCISRQLWWGHRIPVWRGSFSFAGWGDPAPEQFAILRGWVEAGRIAIHFPERGKAIDLLTDDEMGHGDCFICVKCASDNEVLDFLEAEEFVQDPDVLDTWFSSALWPLSTMGWPDPERAARDTGIADFPELLEAFNPTDVLCTAREIITLWVSRMVMYNRYFLSPDGGKTPGQVPFKDVFIHAMIQDGEGRKMSKSLGNGVDPLDIISSHGTDAMRFVLCQMTTQTQDVRMPVSRDPATGKNTSPKFDIGRNFCTKLWNAARYALSNLESCPPPSGGAGKQITRADLGLADRWMLSRLESTVRTIEQSLRDYQFSAYATAMYDLLWRDYCDWYLEAVKPTLKSSPAQQAVVQCVLDAILRLLHPICPFITEVLAEPMAAVPQRGIDGLILGRGATTMCRTAWPIVDAKLADPQAEREFARIQALVEAIRQARSAAGIKNSEKLTLHATAEVRNIARGAAGVVEAVAGLAMITDGGPGPIEVRFEGDVQFLSGVVVVVDQGAERAGFEAAAAKLAKDIDLIEKRLNNPGYMQKAPAHLVEETRGQLAAKVAEREDLLRRLESVR